MSLPNVTLYFKKGSSDKVYSVWISETETTGHYKVLFEYGPRNKTQTRGVKVDNQTFDDAKKVFDKLVTRQLKRGYTYGEAKVPAGSPQIESKQTNWFPQLLVEVDQETLIQTYRDWTAAGRFMMVQTKHDGERRGVITANGNLTGANRKGFSKEIAEDIQDSLKVLAEELKLIGILDCEDMGDHYVIFDYIASDCESFSGRAIKLTAMLRHILYKGLENLIVDLPVLIYSEEQLIDFIEAAKDRNEEGIVARPADLEYSEGINKECLKLKFWDAATVKVISHHATKRSVRVGVLDANLPENDQWIDVGSCTIPPNKSIPEPGDLVEIRYLYAYPGGSLYQPIYKEPRSDVTAEDCRIAQLKYKKGTVE